MGLGWIWSRRDQPQSQQGSQPGEASGAAAAAVAHNTAAAPTFPSSQATMSSSPEIFNRAPAFASPIFSREFLATLSPVIPSVSLGVGFASGLLSSAERAGLKFMAENAHRRPDTVQGWYFYNKTKNYKVILAGVKGGLKTGLKLAGWTYGWVLVDAAVFRARVAAVEKQQRLPAGEVSLITTWANKVVGHWFDGLLAGQAVAMLAAIRYRIKPFPLFVAGSGLGAIAGGLQDARDYLAVEAERKNHQKQQQAGVAAASSEAVKT